MLKSKTQTTIWMTLLHNIIYKTSSSMSFPTFIHLIQKSSSSPGVVLFELQQKWNASAYCSRVYQACLYRMARNGRQLSGTRDSQGHTHKCRRRVAYHCNASSVSGKHLFAVGMTSRIDICIVALHFDVPLSRRDVSRGLLSSYSFETWSSENIRGSRMKSAS